MGDWFRGGPLTELVPPFQSRTRRRLHLGEDVVYRVLQSRTARPVDPPMEALEGNVTRSVQSPDEPDAPVAGWVPPHQHVSSPFPPPQPGHVRRGPVNDDLVDFIPHKSARSAPMSMPPHAGRTIRTPVPNQGQVSNPIMSRRVPRAVWQFSPPGDVMRGAIRRADTPPKVLAGPYCFVGMIATPGAIAGHLRALGAQAGMMNCGDV